MGERKVVQKYIPPDFDPSLVPRGKKLSSKDGTVPVRMMLPFSVQCTTCNTFLYRGRKFNSKKEPMGGPHGKYLGIQRWRFYIKCTHCSRPLTFCTDPKNADYEMESGGTRNYEVYKDQAKTEEAAALSKEEEEKMDHMKALENRVLDSQREMADLDNLEEIKAMNRRHIQLMSASGEGFDNDAKALLDSIEAKKKKGDNSGLDTAIEVLNEEDEELIKSIQFGNNPKQQQQQSSASSSSNIKRLDEKDEQKLEQARQEEIERLELRQKQAEEKAKEASAKQKKALPIIKTKRKRIEPPVVAKKVAKLQEIKPSNNGGGGLSSLLGGYGSSSDSE